MADITDSDVGSGADAGESSTSTFADEQDASGLDAGELSTATFADTEVAVGAEAEVFQYADAETASVLDAISAMFFGFFDTEVASGADAAIQPGSDVPVQLIDTEFITVVDQPLVGTNAITMGEWWDSNYLFRRIIQIDPAVGTIPAAHPIEVLLPRAVTADLGKVRSDRADIAVLHFTNDLTPTWKVLPYTVAVTPTDFVLRFVAPEDISALDNTHYYVYYGNRNLPGPRVLISSFTDTGWPLAITTDQVEYTRPQVDWLKGVSSVPQAVATFTAYAAQVRFRSTKSLTAGIAELRLDAGFWFEVDLFSRSTLSNVVAYTVSGLDESLHRLQVRVSGRKNPRALGAEVSVDGFDWAKFMTVTLLGEETLNTLTWGVG